MVLEYIGSQACIHLQSVCCDVGNNTSLDAKHLQNATIKMITLKVKIIHSSYINVPNEKVRFGVISFLSVFAIIMTFYLHMLYCVYTMFPAVTAATFQTTVIKTGQTRGNVGERDEQT